MKLRYIQVEFPVGITGTCDVFFQAKPFRYIRFVVLWVKETLNLKPYRMRVSGQDERRLLGRDVNYGSCLENKKIRK